MTNNSTNTELQKIISVLKDKDSKILSRISNDLNGSTRRRREVNLGKINRYTKEGESIIVPGKVLGGGELDHKVNISAFKFSSSALDKLKKTGSKIIPLESLTVESIKGKKVKIIG